jgi:hypothetical protein
MALAYSHSIYIFDAAASKADYWKPQIYQKISQFISEGFAVAYIIEQNETSTIQNFSKMGFPIEDYIESGALTIINKDLFYSPSITSNILKEQWAKLFSTIEKRRGKGNFRGFVAIGMPTDSFFSSEMFQQRLVEYESVVAHNYDGSFEAMCCYNSQSIDKMPLKFTIMLLNSHQGTAHKNGELKEWNKSRGVDIIKRGLDQALGSYVSDMTFQLLLRDFGMDAGAMILYPDKFENKLKILFGTFTGEMILSRIKDEFKNEIMY